MNIQTVCTAAAAAAAVLFFAVLLFRPIRLLFKLALNTVLGFASIAVFNLAGSLIGVSLGLNWLNALVIGLFGLPGAALLLVMKWLALA